MGRLRSVGVAVAVVVEIEVGGAVGVAVAVAVGVVVVVVVVVVVAVGVAVAVVVEIEVGVAVWVAVWVAVGVVVVVKREAELKSLFGAELERQLPNFQVLHYSTNGAPDREIVGLGVTSRWEFKHATPHFDSPADQELVCCQLAAAAHCRYVVWFEHRGVQRTMIVHPRKVIRVPPGLTSRHSASKLQPDAFCVGFDMRWLVLQVLEVHRR